MVNSEWNRGQRSGIAKCRLTPQWTFIVGKDPPGRQGEVRKCYLQTHMRVETETFHHRPRDGHVERPREGSGVQRLCRPMRGKSPTFRPHLSLIWGLRPGPWGAAPKNKRTLVTVGRSRHRTSEGRAQNSAAHFVSMPPDVPSRHRTSEGRAQNSAVYFAAMPPDVRKVSDFPARTYH
jgi:hypothetical protein